MRPGESNYSTCHKSFACFVELAASYVQQANRGGRLPDDSPGRISRLWLSELPWTVLLSGAPLSGALLSLHQSAQDSYT